jgi:hypothetical protein
MPRADSELSFAVTPRLAQFSTIAFLTAGLFVLPAIAPAADSTPDDEPPATKSWVGTWTNRKYKTSGPLKCVATRKDDSSAEATFSGTFVKDPFSYNVTVNTKAEKDHTALTGTATLDGDKYEWSGYVRGKVLFGEFRSLKGHNGTFRLQESSK